MSFISQAQGTGINPTGPLDWTLVAVVAMSVVASVGAGAKKIIAWVVSKITAPDTRIEELEKEKAQRELEDRARFVKLEHDVEKLRAELIQVHAELKLSEISRARLEGEIEALRALLDKYKTNNEEEQ
jgi:septal ring factor EnvC (AmiA/AmiB activator)